MEKLSMDKVAAVLSEVPDVLRALVAERDELAQRASVAEGQLAKIAMQQRLDKVAATMEEKGLSQGRSHGELVAMLDKKAAEGRLEAIEEAVDMSAANKPLGNLGAEPANGHNDLESYLLGELG